MSTGKITTRAAVRADIVAMYGSGPPVSVRAWTLEIDGVVRGVAGLKPEGDEYVVFSDIHADVPKMTVWRCAKQFMAKVDRVVFCRSTETSGPFLERLGWTKLTDDGVYAYAPEKNEDDQ